MTEFVYPNCRTVVRHQGGRVRLNPESPWRADDPFVLARPELFEDEPRWVQRTTNEVPETATRGPGETRNTPPRRPARKTGKKDD